MKKKQRCLLNRFAALLAAIVISLSFPVSALAASDTVADMPSKKDFRDHRGSWFVWRTRSLNGGPHYELCASPVVFDSSGNLDVALSYPFAYKSPSYFDIGVISGADVSKYYACALPVPFAGLSGYWSELPSFPVGSSYINDLSCIVSFYTSSSLIDSNYFAFLSPCYSSSSSVSWSNTQGASTDSITAAEFSTPLYSFPFAFRSDSSNDHRSYVVQGGDSSCMNFSISSTSWISFKSNKFLVEPFSFASYPASYYCPSADLGLVVIKQPSSSGFISQASSFAPATDFKLVPTLLVPAGLLPDVKVGDWLSDSPEDLQKALTNEFGIDSSTLKNSKDNLNSWNSTSSVDSDVASGASGLLGGLFQNLGTFLFSVSLLCFGAVVLRMLIRKAVDG